MNQWAILSLQSRHNGRDGVSNHQPHDCLLNRLFRRRSKETSKLRVTGLCAGNSPVTGEFPVQMASDAENGSIWWRHHVSMLALTMWWCSDSGDKLFKIWSSQQILVEAPLHARRIYGKWVSEWKMLWASERMDECQVEIWWLLGM